LAPNRHRIGANVIATVVVGGGIVGLATALAVLEADPGASLVLLEKESACGRHQTGHNSGVIHSGIYYAPGSMKARLCRAGSRSMVEFCAHHGIDHRVCGKLIVATAPAELAALEKLYDRGVAQGLAVERLGPAGIREREPHATGIAAVWVPETGVVDFGAVAARMAGLVVDAGGEVRTSSPVTALARRGGRWVVTTPAGPLEAARLVTCGGLHSDHLAHLAGAESGARILPFRGEYYEVVPHRRHLVNGLVYPVPDPRLPFLGVHLTRDVHGSVHAGPNAVLGWRREAYRRRDIDLRELGEALAYPGTWGLARRYWRTAIAEQYRSLRAPAFVRALQRLVPEIEGRDVVPAAAGVRAQAVAADGSLVDDFLLVERDGAVHVCNAPSPAATASLEIGRVIAARLVGANGAST
jgi:L-2-hydroxyglutarate oxidase